MLERVINGHGAVVGVAGPPGIGKSRLVRDAAEIAERRGVGVFSVFCESHASQVPFHAVARLLRSASGIEGLDGQTARDQVRNRVPDIWIFSVGMPAALRGFWKRMGSKELPVIARSLPGDLSVREHRLFSGVISRDQIPFTGRLVFRLLGGCFGDYRDWAAIEAWATNIAHELTVGSGSHGFE